MKEEHTIQIALYSTVLKKTIPKDKYQIPIVEMLIFLIFHNLSETKMFEIHSLRLWIKNFNFKLVFAPAEDREANGLIERIVENDKQRVSCVQNYLNKRFNLNTGSTCSGVSIKKLYGKKQQI